MGLPLVSEPEERQQLTVALAVEPVEQQVTRVRLIGLVDDERLRCGEPCKAAVLGCVVIGSCTLAPGQGHEQPDGSPEVARGIRVQLVFAALQDDAAVALFGHDEAMQLEVVPLVVDGQLDRLLVVLGIGVVGGRQVEPDLCRDAVERVNQHLVYRSVVDGTDEHGSGGERGGHDGPFLKGGDDLAVDYTINVQNKQYGDQELRIKITIRIRCVLTSHTIRMLSIHT